MGNLSVTKLTADIGAKVTGADIDTLLNDESVPAFIWSALREHGVLVFPELGFPPAAQVKFATRLGEIDAGAADEYAGERGIQRVSLDPKKNGGQETLRGTFNWHMDGCTLPNGRYPSPATILTAQVLADTGGQTEFASTRVLYRSLNDEEMTRLGTLRVVHSIAGTRRRVILNPTPEQEANWARMGSREHPLIWRHREGGDSLTLGGTAEYVVGMDLAEGHAILDNLVTRATTPERVYRHEWTVGDTVIWDNHGLLHRAVPYDDDSPREMIRTTLVGHEPTGPEQ